jgi:hypothetical protein
MHVRAALLSLLIASIALAQTPGTDPRTTGPGGDPLDKALTGRYFMRYADEFRAKKAMEEARVALRTPEFRDALHSFEPGRLPKLEITWAEFVTAEGTPFTAMQFAAAMKPKSKVTTFGEIVDANGKVLFDFEERLDVQQSKRDVFTERTIIQPFRHAVGTFGIAVGKEILALGRVDIDCEELNKNSTGISRLLLSDSVFNLEMMQTPFDPFAFGGTRVIPKPGRAFRREDETWLFVEMRNPALDANGEPKLTTRLELDRDGRTIVRQPMIIEPLALKGVRNHYGLGTTLDVSSFTPGEYTLRLKVTDEIARQWWTREETIQIVE